MKPYGEKIFTVIILLIISLFIYTALDYKPTARIVPLIVAVPAFFLILAQLYRSFRTGDNKRGAGQEATSRGKIVLEIWLWLIALVATAFYLGLLPAALIFMFCFLRFFSHKGWLTSAVVSLLFFSVIYLLFHTLLEKL
jgi:hypothetical protein